MGQAGHAARRTDPLVMDRGENQEGENMNSDTPETDEKINYLLEWKLMPRAWPQIADLAVVFGRAVTVPLQPQIKRHNKGLMIDPANAVL